MATTAQNKRLIKSLGWESVDEVPDSVWERLEAESAHRQEHNTESVLRYVSTFYEAFKKGDAYIIVSDGAEFITVNAEWVAWAAQGCDSDQRPDYGFNYVS